MFRLIIEPLNGGSCEVGYTAGMVRISSSYEQVKRRLLLLRNTVSFRCKKVLGRAYVRLSILQAEVHLRKVGPIKVLIDNSALGHGVTHETAWMNTGRSLWGGQIPENTGYSTRIPVHAPNSSDRLYREVTYLVGIAELAKRGHIKLVTSAELQAESLRQPIGRFRGYGAQDLNVFDDIHMPSVDGHHFDAVDPKAAQQARLAESKAEPFATLARLLPKKSNLDAWHIHTAHKYDLYCFLAVDFPLIDNFRRASQRKEFPQLNVKLMLPSELAAAIQLRPIETFAISYQNASWFVHPELSSPDNKRTSPRRGTIHFNPPEPTDMPKPEAEPKKANSPINILPAVGEMMGVRISYGHEAVGIQYKDKSGQWQQLDMALGDAMYLLSILKGMQLSLDIPFPDDPRDPNATPVRPSEVDKISTPTANSANKN
ncbi:hypothetical protein FF80_01367 [Devosia sp. LC5]|uniref:hypothetical protein n=1 Tax=Devosia sp. LC5 TaxID=1502724 RepID=UPI0004E41F50|nr:hypothetical protein [Devosia sp. LC5]KFC69559.1 hypothetical protein FF80_01367 [Devosia sp. LC5]